MNNRTILRGVSFAFVAATLVFSPVPLVAQGKANSDQKLIEWIKDSATPLDPGTRDYGRFEEHAKNARIIGLGEATHGQHEAFEFKRQLTMHLIRKHGYRVVAYEANASSAIICNEYITGKSDDRQKAVSGLSMLIWQVKENAKLLDDLRNWNRKASEKDRVRFIGCDSQNGKVVMKRLSRLLGEKNAALTKQLENIQKQLDSALRQAMQGDTEPLKALLKKGQTKCQEVREVARKQSLDASEIDIRLKEFISNLGLYSAPGQRDKAMADLLLAQLDLENPEEKCVFWGHNGHVQRGQLVLGRRSVPAMGGHLAKVLGEQYYAVGFDFGKGEFQANVRDNNNRWRFRRYRHSAAPDGSMAAIFDRAMDKDFILDLRSAKISQDVDNWLRSAQTFRSWGGYNIPEDFDDHVASPLHQCVPKETYDAFVFHHHTTAAQPIDPKLIIN